jgi:hypothetical protein
MARRTSNMGRSAGGAWGGDNESRAGRLGGLRDRFGDGLGKEFFRDRFGDGLGKEFFRGIKQMMKEREIWEGDEEFDHGFRQGVSSSRGLSRAVLSSVSKPLAILMRRTHESLREQMGVVMVAIDGIISASKKAVSVLFRALVGGLKMAWGKVFKKPPVKADTGLHDLAKQSTKQTGIFSKIYQEVVAIHSILRRTVGKGLKQERVLDQYRHQLKRDGAKRHKETITTLKKQEGLFTKLVKFILPAFLFLVGVLIGLRDALGKFIPTRIINAMKGFGKGVKKAASFIWSKMGFGKDGWWNDFVHNTKVNLKYLKGRIGDILFGTKDIRGRVTSKGLFGGISEAFKTVGKTLTEKIPQGVRGALKFLGGKIGSVFGAAARGGKGFLGKLTGMFEGMGSVLKGIAQHPALAKGMKFGKFLGKAIVPLGGLLAALTTTGEDVAKLGFGKEGKAGWIKTALIRTLRALNPVNWVTDFVGFVFSSLGDMFNVGWMKSLGATFSSFGDWTEKILAYITKGIGWIFDRIFAPLLGAETWTESIKKLVGGVVKDFLITIVEVILGGVMSLLGKLPVVGAWFDKQNVSMISGLESLKGSEDPGKAISDMEAAAEAAKAKQAQKEGGAGKPVVINQTTNNTAPTVYSQGTGSRNPDMNYAFGH